MKRKETITYLITNTSDKELILYDFVNELYDCNLTFDYSLDRLRTDSYDVKNRFFSPGKIIEVDFHNNVCILGRLMAKLHRGITKSFIFLKIYNGGNYLLPDGVILEDPETISRECGKEEILKLKNS